MLRNVNRHPTPRSPKTYIFKNGGLTDSESEYSYNPEDELDDLIQYSKQAKAKSAKNSKTDQDFLPNLIIYSTPEGRTIRLEESGLNNQFAGIFDPQIDELQFQKGTPLDPPEVEENQDINDICHEVLMVRISKFHESEDDSMERLNLDDPNGDH